MPVRYFLLLAGLLLALPPQVWAEPNATKQAERANTKALEEYDSLEFETAKHTLQTALAKLSQAGLDDAPVSAITHINLGIVFIALNDRPEGVKHFAEALRIDPTLQLDPLRGTPELQAAFDEAAQQAAGMAKPPLPVTPTVPPETGTTTGVTGLVHTPVDEAKAGAPVIIKVRAGDDVKGNRLFLAYKSSGKDDFTFVQMSAVGDGWSGEIPASAITDKSVYYYIEARDNQGREVLASGSAPSPYIISVISGEKTETEGAGGSRKEGRGFGRIYLDLMLGTGIGIEPAGNKVDVAYQYSVETGQYRPLQVRNTGVVSAPLHIGAELGVQITRHVAVALLGRFEVYTGANADSSDNPPLGGGTKKAFGAAAGMLRFRYQFLEGRFHPYIHIDMGGGYIRHLLDISGSESNDHPLVDYTTADAFNNGAIGPSDPVNEVCKNHANCYDTVAAGYFLFGAGAGIWYDLMKFYNGGLGFVADLNILAAVGEQFGMNFDLQLGLGVHFL